MILPFLYIYVNMHTMKQNFTIHCYMFNLIREYCFQVAIIMGEMVKHFFGIHRL